MAQRFWETILLMNSRKQRIDLGWMFLYHLNVPVEVPSVPDYFMSIGVDPGINFGISVLRKTTLDIFWGKLPHADPFPGKEAIKLVKDLLSPWKGSLIWKDVRSMFSSMVYVEGPSYNDSIGQPLLEQVRFGFVLGFESDGYRVRYIPPMTARKMTFGHGRKKGNEVWTTINQNAADSIPLAICGIELRPD